MSTTSITRCTLLYLPNITISRQGTKIPKDDFSNTTRTTANNETDGLNIVKSMEIKRVASSTQLESCKFLKNCNQEKKTIKNMTLIMLTLCFVCFYFCIFLSILWKKYNFNLLQELVLNSYFWVYDIRIPMYRSCLD